MDKATQILMDGSSSGSNTNNNGGVGTGNLNSNYNGSKLPQTGTNEIFILSMAIFTLGIGVFSLIKYKKM